MEINIQTKDGVSIVISVPDDMIKNFLCRHPETIVGDVNGDGKVDQQDAGRIMDYLSGAADLDDDEKKAADVDGDGHITYLDAMTLMDQLNRGTNPEVGE